MNAEIIVSKKQNMKGKFTDYSISVSIDNCKANNLITITCPADEEQVVIDSIMKIFGGIDYEQL